jgi:hypothetical protein
VSTLKQSIETIRALIDEGLTDDEIVDVLEAQSLADADDEADMLYGPPNTDEDYGRRPCETDEHYERNDAGEYRWM